MVVLPCFEDEPATTRADLLGTDRQGSRRAALRCDNILRTLSSRFSPSRIKYFKFQSQAARSVEPFPSPRPGTPVILAKIARARGIRILMNRRPLNSKIIFRRPKRRSPCLRITTEPKVMRLIDVEYYTEIQPGPVDRACNFPPYNFYLPLRAAVSRFRAPRREIQPRGRVVGKKSSAKFVSLFFPSVEFTSIMILVA